LHNIRLAVRELRALPPWQRWSSERDKAIAADPKKADAYFIKGSVMVGQGAVGKNGKMTVPAGTVETLKQYLVLAPDGGHAKEVNDMLDFLK
jgi:hypothetical protein